MPRTTKIDLAKVLASLDVVCPKCGYRIPPNEVQRIDFTSMKCPTCGQIFDPKGDASHGAY
jgi:DNA-directed RNA polymerase subunit RPC12/RpoP